MSATPLSPAGHARALLALGLPLIGGHLGQFAIGATDTLMLGWYGVTDLAAGVLGHAVFFTFFVMGSGFAWAVMPMVAAASAGADPGEDGQGEDGQHDGAQGDTTRIRRVTRMGLWLSVFFALLLQPLFLSAEPILLAIGQDPRVAALAADYLAIAGWGLIPALAVMVLKSYLAALERTRIVFLVTALAAVVNAGTNWLLIYGNAGFPELGVRGAAIASVVLQVVSLAVLVAYAARVFPGHALFVRLWRADWPAFGDVLRLGWPIGLTNLAEVALFSASAILVGLLGPVPLAAHGIVLQVATATFMVHMGLSNAATIRAGKALGAGDIAGLARGGAVAIAVSFGFAALAIAVFLAMPQTLIGVFLSPDEPQRAAILALGGVLMLYAAAFQAADGAQVMAIGLLRGVQDTRVPMLIAAVSYWGVGITVSYVAAFPLGLGAPGVWAGLVAGLGTAAVLLLHRFWRRALPALAPAPVPAAAA